jgi:hypothetical protein
LFQCAVGEKQIAICATGAPSQGQVQYRYGALGNLELAYPADPRAGTSALRWAMTGYSGGGETQISFENAGVKYVVYSRMSRTAFGADGRHAPHDQLGVAVLKGGKVIATRRCSPAAIEGGHSDWIDEQRTMKLLPQGEFVELY